MLLELLLHSLDVLLAPGDEILTFFFFPSQVNTWREAHPLNGAGKKEKKGCALL